MTGTSWLDEEIAPGEISAAEAAEYPASRREEAHMYTCAQLREAARAASQNPEWYDQRSWSHPAPCGTARCIHGEVVLRATGSPATRGPDDEDYTDHGIPGLAARALLLWETTTPEQVLALLDLPADETPAGVAAALAKLALAPAQVADALLAGLDRDAAETAAVLRDSLGLDVAQVARAMCHGCCLDEAETASAVYCGCGLAPAETARALRDGCVLDAAETARALRDGLGLDAGDVAAALRDGLGLSPADAGRAANTQEVVQ